MKLSRKELLELVELDALCFEPPINYTLGDVYSYTKSPAAILFRKYERGVLIACCIGNSSDGNIVTLDVHPDYRRRGLGRKLLDRMLEEFRMKNVPMAISQVAIDNIGSLKLHRGVGFQIRSILYDYYPDGSAAYELFLPLGRIKRGGKKKPGLS